MYIPIGIFDGKRMVKNLTMKKSSKFSKICNQSYNLFDEDMGLGKIISLETL